MTMPSGDHPQISAVIPTYQRAPLLERALESLTTQTLPRSEFEVVVINDGSSDWTESVCTRLAEELPLRYFRISNSGISAAKNLGLFTSEAPLVLFFDDDDLADPGLLEAHVEAHRAHPDENFAVLGYTTWAPDLDVTPLMNYVTEIGQQLFFYRSIEDGEILDHTFFWGGRSSCKRSFLAQHGTFDQDFPAIIEDIELGFRLAKHGLKVVHARSARSYMARSMTFDDFARRCVTRGRALWLFNRRHSDPAVERFCRVTEALERWPSLAPALDEKVQRTRELEERHASEGELEVGDLEDLYGLYGWAFDALQARGIAEAEAEASGVAPESQAFAVGTPGASQACRDPVFIIGSPRSGTSALAWSLAQHSELWTEAESDIFYYLLKDGHLEQAFETSVARPDGTWLGRQGVDLEQFLAHLGLGLNILLTQTSNGRRWVDQTPANTVVVDRIADMMPGARFIHILRDGRRVVNSMVNFHEALGDPEAVERMKEAGRLPPWTTDFADACRTWARFTRIASDFCSRNPERSFTVTNESLITDAEGSMREVLDFLGLSYEPAPAEFLRTNRINSSFVASGKSEVAPPALSEPWLEWLPQQRSVFHREAGEMMVALGLATESDLISGVEPAGDGGTPNGAGRTESEIRLPGHDRP
jgi:GT2 family glycosyltransferase